MDPVVAYSIPFPMPVGEDEIIPSVAGERLLEKLEDPSPT